MMTRFVRHMLVVASLVVAAPVLSGCETFDMDKLDVFGLNEKKKLPGDRRALFPEGIPGVAQGVPPELVKGYQPPAEEPPPAAAPEPPKPKPKRIARPARITVQPQQRQDAQPADAPWPAQPQQQQQAPQGAQSPWPDAPRSGTFSR